MDDAKYLLWYALSRNVVANNSELEIVYRIVSMEKVSHPCVRTCDILMFPFAQIFYRTPYTRDVSRRCATHISNKHL